MTTDFSPAANVNYYLPDRDWLTLVFALDAAADGKFDRENVIKIALGELGHIWPRSVLGNGDEPRLLDLATHALTDLQLLVALHHDAMPAGFAQTVDVLRALMPAAAVGAAAELVIAELTPRGMEPSLSDKVIEV